MEGGTAMEAVLTAAKAAITFSGECLTTLLSNEVYAFFFGAGLVGVGLMLVRQLKNTARS